MKLGNLCLCHISALTAFTPVALFAQNINHRKVDQRDQLRIGQGVHSGQLITPVRPPAS